MNKKEEILKSLNPDIEWKGVTSIIESFCFQDNFDEIAEKSRKKKSSKWYGMSKEEILNAWNEEKQRSQELGNWYHSIKEDELKSYSDIYIEPVESLPEQRLKDGIYPEHFVYLKSYGICGKSDYVEVKDGVLNITDYKTSKKIEDSSFKSWNGKKKMMLLPLNHIEDCNLNHYALQLSLYMYIVLKHNPKLIPGKLKISHVCFEQEGENKYGYPIYKKDADGKYIIKEVVEYECPYMKSEVKSIIEHLRK